MDQFMVGFLVKSFHKTPTVLGGSKGY